MITINTSTAQLAGTVLTEPTVFTNNDEVFYSFILGSTRPKGIVDSLVVHASRYLFDRKPLKGEQLALKGQVRTYQEVIGDKNHLRIVFFALDAEPYIQDCNEVQFNGFVCKTPNYRVTPLGKEICDLMVAVNRPGNKSDYLPCIVWGRSGKFASRLLVGAEIGIKGRLQSRNYTKVDTEGNQLLKTAYEISVHNIKLAED